MTAHYVYMLASKPGGTIYVGETRDLAKRVSQHKGDFVPGFTRRYGVHSLVWYEVHESVESAKLREKQIKRWRRAWKIRLLQTMNPSWSDLWDSIH